jgi:hypothetical protein
MRVIDLPNVPGMKNTHIRPEFKSTEKEVVPPKYINKIVKDERSGLSLINQIGTYDMLGVGCRDITDNMHLYMGTGIRFNSSSINATPLDPMSRLAYNPAREGTGAINSYDFTQQGNPLVGTLF